MESLITREYIMNNKWIWIGLGLAALVIFMVWGVSETMCKEAVC